MNEPLGLALELAERRKSLAARMSPWALRLAFPQAHRPPGDLPPVVKITKPEPQEQEPVAMPAASREIAPHLYIVASCALLWNIDAKAILSGSHKALHVRPRQAAMVLMRRLLRYSLPRIGKMLRRDHTTVMHALRIHEQYYENDDGYRARFDAAQEQLSQRFTRNAATSDTAAAGGQVDGCTEQPSHRLPASHRRAA
jgi:hypothetical protein